MPKAVYRSSCRDKDNRPRCDSNLSPVTPQSDAHCATKFGNLRYIRSYSIGWTSKLHMIEIAKIQLGAQEERRD